MKLAIRQRKNSLFYATDYSAYIASMLTSLIATCLHAGVNALGIWSRCRSTVRRSLATRQRGSRGITTPTWPRLKPAFPIVSHPGLLGIPIPQHDRQLARRQAGWRPGRWATT